MADPLPRTSNQRRAGTRRGRLAAGSSAVESDDLAINTARQCAQRVQRRDLQARWFGSRRALDDFSTARNPSGPPRSRAAVVSSAVPRRALFPRIGTALAGTRAGRLCRAYRAGRCVAGSDRGWRARRRARGHSAPERSTRGFPSAARRAEPTSREPTPRCRNRRMGAVARWRRRRRMPRRPREIGTEVAAALRANPPTATIDPVTAAHAASQNATQPARRP